ncbi:MAG: hypothetical protein HY675_24705 [Chloroflexi bacterium]|nr:hypothetical protein [Chloroflexota bacterium]
MAKWQYLKLEAFYVSTMKVKRDKQGLYVEGFPVHARLDPQDDWQENKQFRWYDSDALIKDPESDYWRRDTDILNRLGQQGWEAVSLANVQPDGSLTTYLLKRPVE